MVRVFGEILGSWRHSMATGMFLTTSSPGPVDGGRGERREDARANHRGQSDEDGVADAQPPLELR